VVSFRGRLNVGRLNVSTPEKGDGGAREVRGTPSIREDDNCRNDPEM
jgi:hypothetical protein